MVAPWINDEDGDIATASLPGFVYILFAFGAACILAALFL